jgi:hypothetical protein
MHRDTSQSPEDSGPRGAHPTNPAAPHLPGAVGMCTGVVGVGMAHGHMTPRTRASYVQRLVYYDIHIAVMFRRGTLTAQAAQSRP